MKKIFNEALDKKSRNLLKYLIRYYYPSIITRSQIKSNIGQLYSLADLDIIKYLISLKILNENNIWKTLHFACFCSYHHIVKYILEEFITDENKKRLLVIELLPWARLCRLDMLMYLLKYKPIQTPHSFLSLLNIVSVESHKIIVEECREQLDEWLSWIYANEMDNLYSDINVVKCLVSVGLDVKVNNCESYKIACSKGQLDIANYILNECLHTDEERSQCIQSTINYAITKQFKQSNQLLRLIKNE